MPLFLSLVAEGKSITHFSCELPQSMDVGTAFFFNTFSFYAAVHFSNPGILLFLFLVAEGKASLTFLVSYYNQWMLGQHSLLIRFLFMQQFIFQISFVAILFKIDTANSGCLLYGGCFSFNFESHLLVVYNMLTSS